MQTIKDQERGMKIRKTLTSDYSRKIWRFHVIKGEERFQIGAQLKSVNTYIIFWNSFTYISTVYQIAVQLRTRILRNVVRDDELYRRRDRKRRKFSREKCNCRSRAILRLVCNSRRPLTGYREQRWAYKEARPTDPRPDKKLFTSRLIRS